MRREVTLDRRILKAFYTQYVALLLILLVASVSTVSKEAWSSIGKTNSKGASEIKAQIGSIELREMFVDDTSAQLRDGLGLEAVLEVLRNHDVRATVTVYAISQADMLKSYRLALSRAHSIHSAVLATKIPAHAVQLRVASAATSPADAAVSFESMEAFYERS